MPDDRRSGKREVSVQWVRHLVILQRNAVWQPATDAYETPDRFTVVVELAGMRSGEFTIVLQEQRLIIAGKRVRPIETESTAYHQLELQYGEFRVEVNIPWAVDSEGITAHYDDGFLRVDLPRRKSLTSE